MRNIRSFVALVSLGLIVGCGDANLTTPSLAEPAFALRASAEEAAAHHGLATLRRATARYHDVTAAVADGFAPILPCIEDPQAGGLGIPYGNLVRFDATIDRALPGRLGAATATYSLGYALGASTGGAIWGVVISALGYPWPFVGGMFVLAASAIAAGVLLRPRPASQPA